MVTLRPFRSADLDLVGVWLDQPHVVRWYLTGSTAREELEDLRRCVDGVEPTHLAIALDDDRPVGWCQWYFLSAYPDHAAAVGAGPGDIGIDYAIGDPSCVGRGIGTELVAALVVRLRERHPDSGIIADPAGCERRLVPGPRAQPVRAPRRTHSCNRADGHPDGHLPAGSLDRARTPGSAGLGVLAFLSLSARPTRDPASGAGSAPPSIDQSSGPGDGAGFSAACRADLARGPPGGGALGQRNHNQSDGRRRTGQLVSGPLAGGNGGQPEQSGRGDPALDGDRAETPTHPSRSEPGLLADQRGGAHAVIIARGPGPRVRSGCGFGIHCSRRPTR